MTAPLAENGTPWTWRVALLGCAVVGTAFLFLFAAAIPAQLRSLFGIGCLLALVAACSTNLRRLNYHTLCWGMALQVLLALFILAPAIPTPWGPFRPGYQLFELLGRGVASFLAFSERGSQFVFGQLAEIKEPIGFVFAFRALPTIIFVSSFFTVLYYLGVLQFIVRIMARVMGYFMRTSGAETLSASANVFMGQTEAPLIIKPYVPKMTSSELLALMVGGMATVSGGIMALYISLNADPVALLTTSVMAAPCSLYLAKLLLPETEQPQTLGAVHGSTEMPYRNVIDAASSGASDGLHLALNVAAMIIAFLAFIAFFDAILSSFNGPTLAQVFGFLFSPLALLLGADLKDLGLIGNLLGTKLVTNEVVAFTEFKEMYDQLTPRDRLLCVYALTGFANLSSIGIQIGGIGALAPERRGDIARLGPYALLAGFVATLLNAALAGVLLADTAP